MIKVLDAVYSKCDRKDVKLIQDQLCFQRSVRVPSPFGVKMKTVDAYKIDRRNGMFLTGLLNYIKLPKGLKVDRSEEEKIQPIRKPKLKGIKFRPNQEKALKEMSSKGRGVVWAFPGTGKTLTMLGFISQFPGLKSLILCHSIDILKQTRETAVEVGFSPESIGFVDGSHRWEPDADICIASIQSFSKLKPEDYGHLYDIVIVDEAHHCVSESGQYGKVLKNCLAPIRIGMTGSLPTDKEKRLTLFGLLGPVLYKMKFQEGVQAGILSDPKVKIIPVKYDAKIADQRTFRKIYKYGIINSIKRNDLIAKQVKKMSRKGKTSLVMVKEISHGERLVEMIQSYGVRVKFVQGVVSPQDRDKIKADLQSKKLKAVVTTTAWKEGVDIPSLDCVICGYVGKSDISVLQTVGRALRKHKGKEGAVIVDFADPYPYLAQHFVARIGIYVKNGWL